MRHLILSVLALTALGCTPTVVDNVEAVDWFVEHRDWAGACAGLASSVEAIRTHTANKLVDNRNPTTNTCLCDALYDGQKWDAAVAEGVAAEKRDDLTNCLARALPGTTDATRPALVAAIGAIGGDASADALLPVLQAESEAIEVRVVAAEAMRGTGKGADTLTPLLGHADPKLRAAAATGLIGARGKAAMAALVAAVKDDTDPAVRRAAIEAAAALASDDADQVLCDAMLEDPDEDVRVIAVRELGGSTRLLGTRCLLKRANKLEESGKVRKEVLAALQKKAKKNDQKAKDFLCDGIADWARSYVVDKTVDKIEGGDIIVVQNDVDQARSYECVEKANKEAFGFACHARNYVSGWFRTLGGETPVPRCEGTMEAAAGDDG